MYFRLYALRLEFTAHGRLQFRAGEAANLVRGALGAALRRISCPPACPRPGDCPQQPPVCAYARLFEPRSHGVHAHGPRPSGLSDWPRPFVLRVAHLEGATIPRGSNFHLNVHLFDLRPGAITALDAAFAQLGRDGLGPERTAATLTGIKGGAQPLEILLSPSANPVRRIMVRFLTPTELKGGLKGGNPNGSLLKRSEESAGLPPFELLATRIRDRVSTLRALYGEGPLPIDFRGFAARAAGVQAVGGAVRQVAAQRRSRSTGQTHSLGGFAGEVEYAGDLTEFLPYLRAAAFTGVGRQTVWGKGEISVDSVD